MTRPITPLALDERPNPARILDFLRGGAHTFAADRTAGTALLAAAPQLRTALRAEQAFRRHTVLRAITGGIDEIVELGAGIAPPGTIAGIDARLTPATVRVVVTDADPVAVEQQRLAHADRPNVTVVHADPHQPDDVLDQVAGSLQLHGPVLVLCLGLLHHLTDPAAHDLLHSMAQRLPAGSRLAASHLVSDKQPAAAIASLTALYATTSQPLHLRTRHDVRAMLRAASLVDVRMLRPHHRYDRPDRRFLALAAPVVPGPNAGRLP